MTGRAMVSLEAYAELSNEVERLRGENAQLHAAGLAAAGEANRALAEIEKLRAERERYIGSGAQLLAENGRLRGQLAAANALLVRCSHVWLPNGLSASVRAHLAKKA